MASEKVTIEQAVQKLSEANNNSNTRLNALEAKLDEIHLNLIEQHKNMNMDVPNEMMNVQEKMINQIETIQKRTEELQATTTSKLEEKQQQWEQLTNNIRDMRTEMKTNCEALETKALRKNDQNQLMEENVSTPHTQLNSSAINESFDNGESDHHNITEQRQQAENNARQMLLNERPAQTAHTIIIPPSSSIPTFSGSTFESPRTVLEWYCQLRVSNRRPQAWIEFKIIFLNQFNSPIRRARQEQQWKDCKQEEDETINEFIVRLRALWQEQKPNETENDPIRHLMCKMRNNLLTMIGISRCESLDEIITEAPKIEEILYQRNKQQHRNDNHDLLHNDIATTAMYNNDDHHEVQTMLAHQTNQQTKSNNRGNFTSNRNGNYNVTPRQSYYSTQGTRKQRNLYSLNETKCYMCGRKGHFRKDCPYQYNTYQQQNTWHYSKNADGAHDGRDHGAPN
ncbi:unnamed protein product [Rotaria socialis]|uniref:CCHC-type domain-containing protein n=2 Tax=Rotaria socialis TaxID=392032 RepID=A0A817V6B6_9BILA|nr:unnamed protein product [Rotaria socialis]CAF4575695.1 unnamed protein product [Rotaria socialis]